MHQVTRYLLCARNWQDYGSLKVILKRALYASLFSLIWFSGGDFHQRKNLSLPFMNH